MAEAFVGGGADGRDDHLLECRTKALNLSVFLQHLHDMIHLGGIGDEEHRHLPGNDFVECLPERPQIFRERPAIDGNLKDLGSALFQGFQQIRI